MHRLDNVVVATNTRTYNLKVTHTQKHSATLDKNIFILFVTLDNIACLEVILYCLKKLVFDF